MCSPHVQTFRRSSDDTVSTPSLSSTSSSDNDDDGYNDESLQVHGDASKGESRAPRLAHNHLQSPSPRSQRSTHAPHSHSPTAPSDSASTVSSHRSASRCSSPALSVASRGSSSVPDAPPPPRSPTRHPPDLHWTSTPRATTPRDDLLRGHRDHPSHSRKGSGAEASGNVRRQAQGAAAPPAWDGDGGSAGAEGGPGWQQQALQALYDETADLHRQLNANVQLRLLRRMTSSIKTIRRSRTHAKP